MDSIGERLKRAREQKGLNHEQIARDTNIAKRYLVALEEEDFQVFPGEPYLLGFLRNYADYLGLKAEELVSAYRNMKIQEQPTPVHELLDRRKAVSPMSLALIVGGSVLAAALVTLIVVLTVQNRQRASELARSGQSRKKAEYKLDSSPFEKRFYVGDSLLFAKGGETYKMTVDSIGDAVFLETPAGKTRVAMGEDFGIDFDADSQSEVRGTVRDFKKGSPDTGAEIRFEFSPDAAAALSAAGGASPAPAASASPAPSASAATAVLSAADAAKGQILIESKNTPYPFTMNVTFRQYCMFRHEVDKKDRVERYYRKADQISTSANNGIKIWLSNASSCAVQVIGAGKTVNVDLGKPGEVVVKNIKWVQTETGSWALTSLPVN
jgi:cytoskeleton protein RodZ